MTTPERDPRWLPKLLLLRWYQVARLIAALLLLDQVVGPITHMPDSDAIVVACLGAIFAPIPTEKR